MSQKPAFNPTFSLAGFIYSVASVLIFLTSQISQFCWLDPVLNTSLMVQSATRYYYDLRNKILRFTEQSSTFLCTLLDQLSKTIFSNQQNISSYPHLTLHIQMSSEKKVQVCSYFIDENYPQNYLVYGLWRQGLQFVQKIRVVVQQQQ